MASVKLGMAVGGSESRRGRKKASRRWCFICGRELLTCRRYSTLSAKVKKDPNFLCMLSQIIGEDIPCIMTCYICEQCDTKLCKVSKTADVRAELKDNYIATKTKFSGSGNDDHQSPTTSAMPTPSSSPQRTTHTGTGLKTPTISSRTTPRIHREKRKAADSPGTPTTSAIMPTPSSSPQRATQTPTVSIRTTPRMHREKRKAADSPGTPSTRKPIKKRISFTSSDPKDLPKAKVVVQYHSGVQTRELSGHWIDVAVAICTGDMQLAAYHVLQSEDAQDEVRQVMAETISREVSGLCDPQNPSLFRGSALQDFRNFNYSEQNKELEARSPLFCTVLHAAAENVPELKRNKLKTKKTLVPGITTAAGILLNCRSQTMNAHQILTSLALKQSSAKKRAFDHLQSRFVCSSYKTVIQRQVAFGIDFDKEVRDWAEANHEAHMADKQTEQTVGQSDEACHASRSEVKGFQLVTDNVDIVIHPRHSSREKHGTDLHMVQIIAVQNRVEAPQLPADAPIASVSSLDIAEFLPTIGDNQLLKHDWKILMGNIIAKHLPSLNWLSAHIPEQISHPHMAELQQKSKTVNLGVLMADENSTEGIYKIMHHLHSYVPGHGTEMLQPIISAGDLLTCERESSCKMEQSNSSTPSKRLEGLVPVISDFHALANFYQVIWMHLYDTTSSGDKGTLYAARNFLQARQVTTDPMRNINAAADLINQYTIALVIAAALNFFGMESISDHPTKNDFHFATHQDRNHYIQTVLGEIVDKYAVPSSDELKQDSPMLSCPHCQKKYATQRGLKNHMRSKHPGVQHPPAQQQALATDKDALFNYSRTALSLCMLAYDFTDARQMGDGERLIRLYKFFLLHFKAAKKPKYSYQVLRLLAQIKCFLSPRLAYELKWNRFVNKTGKAKSNIEVDREIEHQNRVFKESCGGLRGKVTKDSIDRISRSAQVIDELLTAVNCQASVHKASGKHPRKITKDHLDLAMELHRDNVFDFQAGRRHFHFPDFPYSVLSTLNARDVNKWVKSSLKRMSLSN